MEHNYMCISIPTELMQYTKNIDINEVPSFNEEVKPDFGVKLNKDEKGNLTYAAYYSDSGELLKKIYYNGSTISSIEHYRYNALYSQEKYYDGKITKKIMYNRYKKILFSILYEYNRKDQITAIRKFADNSRYEIEYGYDELMRVNSRSVKVNNKLVANQCYRYDILDRIVEYKDDHQTIKVLKLNQKNQLMSYSIIDKLGNNVSIINKYICSEYIGTEIDLNGHKTTIYDLSYTDNVMLKKPFTSEDDLDLVVSKMLIKPKPENPPISNFIPITQRKRNIDISTSVINDKKACTNTPLPISRRKMQLLQSV